MNSGANFGVCLLASVAVAGCMNMSGLDASESFSCKAAPGVTCQSISGVHQNAATGNLPFQRGIQEPTEGKARSSKNEASKDEPRPEYGAAKGETKVSPRNMSAAYSGMPVRQPPLVLRVWMAPYEDESGDLYDQSFFYTMVHSGKWMIEANRSAISNQFRPIYPLNKGAVSQEQAVVEKDTQPVVKSGQYDNFANKPEPR